MLDRVEHEEERVTLGTDLDGGWIVPAIIVAVLVLAGLFVAARIGIVRSTHDAAGRSGQTKMRLGEAFQTGDRLHAHIPNWNEGGETWQVYATRSGSTVRIQMYTTSGYDTRDLFFNSVFDAAARFGHTADWLPGEGR